MIALCVFIESDRMNYEQWLIYLLVINATLYIPGPMNIFLITNSAVYGYRRTVFSVLGGGSAYLILMLLVIQGLDILINRSPFIYPLIKLVGASYFIYLGVKQFLKKKSTLSYTLHSVKRTDFYLQGFWVGILNPKALILFISLFSQFLQPAESQYKGQVILLMSTFLICQFISASLYALIGANLYKKLQTQYFVAEKLTLGSILIALGVCLIIS